MENSSTSTTNIHTIVKAQIVFLLSTLTEDNYERNQLEIRSLSEQHGIDTYLHFIRRLIAHSHSRLSSSNNPTVFDTSNSLTFRLLVQETQRLARDPYLAERFRDGVDRGEGEAFRNFDFVRFVDRVGLRPLERLVLAAPIVSSPVRKEFGAQAQTVIMQEFENAVLSLCHNPSFDLADLSPNQVTKLLGNLLSDPPAESPVLDASQRQALIVAAQTKYGKDTVAPMLQRILPSLSLPPGTTLVQALMQLGPDITADADTVRALLARFGITDVLPPQDEQVIDIMSNLSRRATEGAILCDIAALVRALNSFPSANINWAIIIKSFDVPERHGVDTPTLKLLIAILLNCSRDTNPHAVTGFWSIWSNALYQLRLLDALLSLPGDTFNFVHLPGRRIVTVEDVAVASPTIKSLAANVQGHTWNSLDLFEVLVKLADSESTEIRNVVREMLDKAIKISAELVHMGLLQVPDAPWNEIRLEYSRKLLAMFLAGHPNHQLVFMRIWQIQPTYLTDAFRDFYEENPLNITRILDVAQDLKILEALLEVRPFGFALDVAALASRREYLNLDKWLMDNVTNHGAEFLHSVLMFLEEKMQNEKTIRIADPQPESRTMPLNPNTITIILRMLRNSQSQMADDDKQFCLDVKNHCLQVHPRLMSMMPNSDIEPGYTVISYSTEIEAEVDGIYKQMYDENTTIDEVIDMLQRYKNSNNPREHEVFSCMLHFLFDEYKFFQSYYPARELAMTGYLFGSLIQHQLIDYIPLGIAIRYILDALNCPPETNLFKFGIQALTRFESRLREWKPLCETLVQNPNLAEAKPELVSNLHKDLAVIADGVIGADVRVPPVETIPVFSAIQPDAVTEPVLVPVEEVSDKILFIINNLAPSNFSVKLEEMQGLFRDEYSRWFANYLVDQRISTEPNNHSLYLRFLDSLNRQKLSKYILHETFVKSASMLNSERALQFGTERTNLKNVAIWLGLITLAKDIPIKHKNISFKDLLIEGYESGRSIISIPFVCKVLEGCAHSKVFKPPNPWLMGVMSLLAEIYFFADVKLKYKFEIEVLCTLLDINLDAVEPSTILRTRPLTESLAGPPLPEYVTDIDSLPIGPYDSAGAGAGGAGLGAEGSLVGAGDGQSMLPLGPSSPSDPARVLGSHIESILSTLVNIAHVNSQLSPLNTQPTFKRAVALAVERAVREIILPVVERSVTIAGISTRELVAKDFATESNEDKMRKAGHLMAQKLAGSLALVTCKEPLKSNLAIHIRQFLAENSFADIAQNEAVISILVSDNLDFACAAIEKAAMERAVADVDEGFAAAYDLRRRHRELRLGQYLDQSIIGSTHFNISLPDPLRVAPNGVQANQTSVYEDFAGIDAKKRNTSRPSSTMSFTSSSLYPPTPADSLVGSGSHQDAMDRFNIMTRDLEALFAQLPVNSLAALPPNHDVRYLIRNILNAANMGDRQRTPLQMSQKIVQLLYKASSSLGREVYVALLQQLCNTFEDVAKEAITWLLYAEDERKFNIPVTVTLLRSSLLNVGLLDQALAKTMYMGSMGPRPSFLNFIAGLIRECLSSEPPVASQAQFQYCIEMLTNTVQEGKATDQVSKLLDDLRGVRHPVMAVLPESRQPSTKPGIENMREKLLGWFQQWINIYQRSHSPEKNFVPFITQLTKAGIVKDDTSSLFFRVCAEASVNSYLKSVAAGEYDYAYQALDAMSRLIVYMIKYHGDPSGGNVDQAKAHYLSKILSIFVLVLANFHEEQGVSFQSKPFFRFFSSLINDLHSMEVHLGTVYFQLLFCISDTFISLQPTNFPGFAFSWMCLISHRLFMPKLLLSENREGWSAFHKLLGSLFKFLAPFLKEADLQVGARDLYRGALRLLLVLLHDFPEFLSEYYFTLCDVIPPRCIQLRNIILSAFPLTIILPDPHLRNVSLESIPEMGPIPPILSDFASALQNTELRGQLDQFLLNRGSPSFLLTLKDKFRYPGMTDAMPDSYNISLINTVVMYIGVSSVAQAKARSGTSLFVPTDPGVVALQYLAMNMDVEGQHHLLSAMVLHLRYPNAHTHWFSALLLHLFLEVKDDKFREVMTKVLLERFIVHRPHPWGALITFIELLRNPKYEFWNKDFIRIAPEVSLLLESVATSVFQTQ
ncbi:Not1-domain-containing protein [Lentinula detonsa]|uniref:General negative regulator of transcription subunit 1 n=1 Tax=Lentinula detonsa TaxID=2804962 RepID=A0A9W8TVN6_9AGAR|nr:Not1-domain-containing protein [Lentinula detonsa]